MLTAAKTLLECVQVARNTGLLALEDFADELQEYEGLEYLMILVGVRAIQEGEKPTLINKKIRQLLPDEISKMKYEQLRKLLKDYESVHFARV